MLYQEEEKIKESLFLLKKENIEQLKKEITTKEDILHKELLNYIRESIVLSKKEYSQNNMSHYTINILSPTEEDRIIMIDYIKKVIKESFKKE